MDNITRVKEELHLIRKTNRLTVLYAEAEKTLQAKQNILGEDAKPKEIEKIQSAKEEIKQCIRLTADLETKYMEAINKLSPINQKIIIAKYISGRGNAYIGYQLGYVESAVRDRLLKAYKKLAEILYKEKEGN